MKVDVNLAIVISLIIGGVTLIMMIASLTLLSINHIDYPASLVTLFTMIAATFVTGIGALLSHTLGFQNGTTNGENAAQAQALRTVMHTDDTGDHHQ